MEYVYIIPTIEVLVFNLITLNCCFKRKYSLFKTIAILCVFTVLLISPGMIYRRDIYNGEGRFSILGFIYIIPLKLLYEEKIEKLFLNMCMGWTYTLGILAISIQISRFLGISNYDLSLVIIETVLFMITFVSFKKYVIPKYIYIFQNMHNFRKTQFGSMEMSVYLNFLIMFILHMIFLNSEKYLLQIIVLAIVLVANFLFYFIVYEVISSSIKINELEKKVTDDALTGLGNRIKMMRHIRILIEENKLFSVMFLDLDRFKLINDQYGHEIGDKYLIHFGKVFSDELKDKGKLYRYGGDEFVAIYYGVLTEEMTDSMTE